MIIFATAEPFGHYHLHPYAAALGGEAIHLIPYPQNVQGKQALRVTADLGILDVATLLVVTGGTLTSWTEALSWEATRRGIPVVLSETAYPSSEHLGRTPPPFALITASSVHAQTLYAAHLNMPLNQILVLGHPHLDGISSIPAPKPIDSQSSARVLMLSSVDLSPGYMSALTETINILSAAGHQVTVRPHPREPISNWTGYTVSDNPGSAGLHRDLAEADIVVGVPGTAYLTAAAAHRPLVTVLDADSPQDNAHATFGYETLSLSVFPEDILDAILAAKPAPQEHLEYFTGPIEGSVARHVMIWKSLIK